MVPQKIQVNRAPVLALWAAVVAERQGYDRAAALTLGKAVAGLNAQSKGRMLGIFGPPKAAERGAPKKRGLGEEFWIEVCGRPVPAKTTPDGIRAVIGPEAIDPASVQRYLESKFRDDLRAVETAMRELAAAFSPDKLADAAYGLYEQFRPQIASGRRGWGQLGELDLGLIGSLKG